MRSKFTKRDDLDLRNIQQSSTSPWCEVVRSDFQYKLDRNFEKKKKFSVPRTNAGKVEGGSIKFEDVRKVSDGFITIICHLLKTCI